MSTNDPHLPTRRIWLTDPGESLLLSKSPIGSLLRFSEAARDWGRPPESLLPSPLCAVPLPLSLALPTPPRPGGLWNPLLWLPEPLTRRRMVRVDGEEGLEDDDLWAVRLTYELEMAGIHDPESGSWMDVLAGVGIDISTPDGVERTARWVNGGRDAALSAIDLSELFVDTSDPNWALDAAVESMPELRLFSWAFGSDSLLIDLDAMREDVESGGRSPEGAISDLSLVAAVGGVWMSNLPLDLAVAGGDEWRWWEAFGRRVACFSGSRSAFCEQVIDTVVVRLEQIREATWPQMEAIKSHFDRVETETAFSSENHSRYVVA